MNNQNMLSNLTNKQAVELIKRRHFQIALHSTIYYLYDTNIIEDFQYDKLCRDLVELQKLYPKEARKSPLYEAFRDFDGSTGFHLVNRLNFEHKALCMLRLKNRR